MNMNYEKGKKKCVMRSQTENRVGFRGERKGSVGCVICLCFEHEIRE